MPVPRWWMHALVVAAVASPTAVGAQDTVTRTTLPSASNRAQGTFEFVVRSGAAGVVAEGWFTVTDDSVNLEMTPGPCRYDTSSRPGGSIGYLCADVRVAFDRIHPSVRAMLTYQKRVMVRTVVCDAWNFDARGNRTTCRRSHVETVESVVPTTVRLKPTRP